jgi:hypothetical protein
MRARKVTLPELALIGGTRAALGAGVALLLADRLSDEQRRAVGWTLLAVGVLTTIPLAAEVVFGGNESEGLGEQGEEGEGIWQGRQTAALSP